MTVSAYRVDGQRSRVVVRARSSIHDTSTTWDRVEGTIEADPATLGQSPVVASFAVDMSRFDAGDWLKNRKLGKDMDVARHPTARFVIRGLRDVVRADDGSFRAVADGVIAWRGREVAVAVRGEGTADERGVTARGTFELDIRALGMTPPRFLMFKVESEVTVEVTLIAAV